VLNNSNWIEYIVNALGVIGQSTAVVLDNANKPEVKSGAVVVMYYPRLGFPGMKDLIGMKS
jgi:hypothetical protein